MHESTAEWLPKTRSTVLSGPGPLGVHQRCFKIDCQRAVPRRVVAP
jgi:hypothetical protein